MAKHPEIILNGLQIKSLEKAFKLSDALSTIEEECGRCEGIDECESCQENGEECEYPNNISWGGGHWGMVVNFGTGEVGS